MNSIQSVFWGPTEASESFIRLTSSNEIEKATEARRSLKDLNSAKAITTARLFGKDWVRIEHWDGAVKLVNMDHVIDMEVTGFGK